MKQYLAHLTEDEVIELDSLVAIKLYKKFLVPGEEESIVFRSVDMTGDMEVKEIYVPDKGIIGYELVSADGKKICWRILARPVTDQAMSLAD